MTNLSISVVLPAHNEAENIRITVENCIAYLEQNVLDYEVVVVNDGSTDDTQKIVEELQSTNSKVVLVNHTVNMGYGSALRSGFDKASCEYIFFMDSDGQFDINDLDRLIPLVSAKDVVIGYREDRADSFIRLLNAWLYGLYIYLTFPLCDRVRCLPAPASGCSAEQFGCMGNHFRRGLHQERWHTLASYRSCRGHCARLSGRPQRASRGGAQPGVQCWSRQGKLSYPGNSRNSRANRAGLPNRIREGCWA